MFLIQSELEHALWTYDSELIGCPRRNRATSNLPPPWSFMRGNGILRAVGTPYKVDSPVGPFTVYHRTDPEFGYYVLMFRGGARKPWWEEDAKLLSALVKNGELAADGTMIISELDSQLHFHYVPALNEDESKKLVADAVQRWQSNGRINKSSPRANAYCFRCPIKAACDELDLQSGSTSDWPEGYIPGLRS